MFLVATKHLSGQQQAKNMSFAITAAPLSLFLTKTKVIPLAALGGEHAWYACMVVDGEIHIHSLFIVQWRQDTRPSTMVVATAGNIFAVTRFFDSGILVHEDIYTKFFIDKY